LFIRGGLYDVFRAAVQVTPLGSLQEREQGHLLGLALALHGGTWGAERILAKLERDLLPARRGAWGPKLTALLEALLRDEQLSLTPAQVQLQGHHPRAAAALQALVDAGADPRPGAEERLALFGASGSATHLLGLSERYYTQESFGTYVFDCLST
jgi:hypothetical protein